MKLSETMQSCLDFIDRQTTDDEPWVEIPSHMWSIRTLHALRDRGLVEVRHRKHKFNPNKFPTLTREQIRANAGSVYWDPWARRRKIRTEGP